MEIVARGIPDIPHLNWLFGDLMSPRLARWFAEIELNPKRTSGVNGAFTGRRTVRVVVDGSDHVKAAAARTRRGGVNLSVATMRSWPGSGEQRCRTGIRTRRGCGQCVSRPWHRTIAARRAVGGAAATDRRRPQAWFVGRRPGR